MISPPAADGWLVEKPRPADRGLVVRLLEQLVAADPSVAPEVADGSMRPGPWLQRIRPAWSGIVVDPEAGSRTVIGYAAVVADPASGHRVHDVLVATVFADRGVEAALRTEATAAVRELAGAPSAAAPSEGLQIDPVTYPDVRVDRPRRRLALVGAAVIVAVGTLGVLAVQVGAGPLGGVLPFLEPSGISRDEDPAGAPTTSPAPVPTPQAVVVAGAPIPPQPLPIIGPTGFPTGSATGGPSASGSPTGAPTTTPPAAPGPTSSLLDPVVASVVDTVDGLTGGALSPATGPAEQAGDELTDTLDELLPIGLE